ncbi:uncharacterized protein BDW43DRAFT_295546 [Aspergillus alliaceus]|uniref:uncharacterized protein n=1 Tax=Petromyces alliaceus TaxID=209559 RepID=UPI0012A732D7|nr:uncharacterized protein BDW43DRAFT_295546 [Aspergillus alliaceus]KAB8226854.1 hypothetical protein BDW43DRAFT_295546 [Aspergillus alliaceus]
MSGGQVRWEKKKGEGCRGIICIVDNDRCIGNWVFSFCAGGLFDMIVSTHLVLSD